MENDVNKPTSEQKLQSAAYNAYQYFVNPSQKTFEACHADKDYWERFISDYPQEHQACLDILKAIDEGDPNIMFDSFSVIQNLTLDLDLSV
tara:strand:+ start:101725 stop:101997 length:273 start_codon:yes stop_codon:yes gene_type:complete